MPLWKLVKYKLAIFLSHFTRGGKKKRYLRIATPIVIAIAFVGFCAGAYGIFKAIGLLGEDGFLMASMVVVLAFHGLLILAFVFDIAATNNIFFLSSDLNLLMAAPLPAIRVFALKYLEALASGSLITFFIAFPLLFGFGVAFGAPWHYYPAILLFVGVFLTIPVSIGTLCGLLISRFIPASRVKEVLGVAGGVLALVFWIAIQLVRPVLSNSASSGDIGARMEALATYGNNFVVKLLPSHTAATGLTRIAAGEFKGGCAPFAQLVLVASAMIIVSIVLAERMYVTGWAKVAPSAGGKRRRPRRQAIRKILRWLPPLERSVVAASTSLFVRDPQQVTPIAMVTIMMALLPFFLAASRSGLAFNPVLLLQSFAALSFVGSMNLAISAVAIDGRNFWMMLASPCPARRKLFSKLLVAVFFFMPLVTAIAVAFRSGGIIGWGLALKGIWLASCMTFIGASLGLLLGISYTDWEWEMPKRMLKTSGRLMMLGVMGSFFATLAIVLAALSGGGTIQSLEGIPWIVLFAAGAVTALLTYILVGISARKMENMEWMI